MGYGSWAKPMQAVRQHQRLACGPAVCYGLIWGLFEFWRVFSLFQSQTNALMFMVMFIPPRFLARRNISRFVPRKVVNLWDVEIKVQYPNNDNLKIILLVRSRQWSGKGNKRETTRDRLHLAVDVCCTGSGWNGCWTRLDRPENIIIQRSSLFSSERCPAKVRVSSFQSSDESCEIVPEDNNLGAQHLISFPSCLRLHSCIWLSTCPRLHSFESPLISSKCPTTCECFSRVLVYSLSSLRFS